MKAFLLAAGHGTRLRPITDRIPKCLVPIQGQPLLAIWLELFRRAGIREVFVNAHAHADCVRDYLAERHNDLKIHLSEEPVLLGSAGTLFCNRKWVESEPFFWVFYADVLTCADLGKMRDFHLARRGTATLGVYEVPDPSRCGIVLVDEEGVVRDFVEKPASPRSNLAFAGILIGTPQLLRSIPERLPADLGFEVLPRLIGSSFAYTIHEYLLDIGTMENYEKAQQTWPGL
jgi:mannose-1-phosphate guanylyltransferase